MRKTFLTSLLMLLSVCFLFGQEMLSVKGTVTEKGTGEGLIGVTVFVQGTTGGTVTNIAGQYELDNLPKGSVLVFSSVGMKTKTFVVNKSCVYDLAMEADVLSLEDVVVVGYGTSKKRDLTGSIVSINGDDLKNVPQYSPVNALQGKVPSLMVTNTGSAGGGASIRLRGVGTLNSSTNPLFVVDGMLTDNIDFLSPSDITSIEVLKDPSSLAIFGVQGANGVIILTTNRAKEGKLTVSYDGYGGMQYVSSNDRVKLTNANQFTGLYNELLKNQATEDKPYRAWYPDLFGEGTDWVDLVLRPAAITSHSLTIANSSEKASSVLSAGYFYQDGVLKYDNYNRYNLRYAGDYNVSKHIKIGSNITLSRWSKSGQSANLWEATHAIPTYSPYGFEEDLDPENPGSKYTPSPSIQKDVANPVATMELQKGTDESYGYRGVGNAYIEVNFLKDFQFKATGYADLGVNYNSNFDPKYDVNNETSISSQKKETNSFSRGTAEYEKYQADFILNYKKQIDDHRINATAGYTAYLKRSKGFTAAADTIGGKDMNVVPEDFWMLSQGSPKNKSNGDSYDSEAFISYLARVNYAYKDRYLLTATFRADGSSKFAPSHRWGYFPSVGAGWVMSEENFMSSTKSFLDYLKLKMSWGQLGNDKIGNYLWLPTINPIGQQVIIDGQTYYIPLADYQVDKNIHWEVMSGFDVGVDAKFFGNRLSAEIGYYIKTTRDLLAHVSPSVTVGGGYAITNAGSIRNSGFEFMLNWNDQIGDLQYGVSLNGSTLNNEVLELGDNNSDIVYNYHRTSVGHSIGSFYGYIQDGIFQNEEEIKAYDKATSWENRPGDIRYKDLNGDGKISDKDRTFIGNPMPKFMYGLNLNLSYKGFDFSVDMNGVYGNKILNKKKLSDFTIFNFYESTLGRWHGEGTSSFEPILDNTRSHNFLPSTNLLENGSYFRIRGVQLGYTLPKDILKKMKVSKIRFYANVQNLYTFKKNTGFTPEVGGSILEGGVDNGDTYPIPTTVTAGLSFNF